MAVLNKKLRRDILKSKGQIAAIMLVVMSGIACFVCFYSAYRNMLLTKETYYRKYNFCDLFVPLEKAPNRVVHIVNSIEGVKRSRGRIVKDVNLDLDDDSAKIARIISLPDRKRYTINDIHISSGRYFSADRMNEVIVNDKFAQENNLKIGDIIRPVINNRKQRLKIIGTALSPEYVYMIRNARDFIANPKNFGVFYVRNDFAEMAFDMREACNEIILLLEDGANPDEIGDIIEKKLEKYGAFITIKTQDQISNNYLTNEINGLKVSATIMPVVFLGIASFILQIMLGRLVKRQRTEIGLLKAYGYSNRMIMMYYVKFSLIVVVTGGIVGELFGEYLAKGMIKMYIEFFQFPILRYRFYPDIFFISLLISAAFGLTGSLSAVRRVIRILPAEAMRPEAPRTTDRSLIERINILWNNLSFTSKMTIRNIFRYKIRSVFSIIGVGLATGLLIIGYFMVDSMNFMLDQYYSKVQRQDVKISFETEKNREAFYEVKRLNHVRKAEPLFEYPFQIIKGWQKKDLLVTGLTADSKLYTLLDMSGKRVEIEKEGLIIPDKVARELDIKVGDIITLKPHIGKIKKERKIKISKIISQYLGLGGFMDIDTMSRLMDEEFVMNAALLKVDQDKIHEVNDELKDVPAVAVVNVKRDVIINTEKTMAESMWIMNFFLIFFSGVIAFAIIYNSTSIMITERRRELASLRVMGFTPFEVGSIVFNENIILSISGIIVGIPIGLYLSMLIVKAYDTDFYRMPFHIENRTFILSAIVIMVFVFISNLISKRKIISLNMVEALKIRE